MLLAITIACPLIWIAGLVSLVISTGSRSGPIRHVEAHCTKCGYDLRGIAKRSICPECGTAWLDRQNPPMPTSGTAWKLAGLYFLVINASVLLWLLAHGQRWHAIFVLFVGISAFVYGLTNLFGLSSTMPKRTGGIRVASGIVSVPVWLHFCYSFSRDFHGLSMFYLIAAWFITAGLSGLVMLGGSLAAVLWRRVLAG